MRVPRQILFIDAYDSFTNNVVGLLEKTLRIQVTVIRNDSASAASQNLKALLQHFDAVVIGPGPGHPANPHDIGLISQLWELDDVDLLPILGVYQTLLPLAWDYGDDANGPVLLAVRHATKPFWGVQFHPESECTTAAAAQTMISNCNDAELEAHLGASTIEKPEELEYCAKVASCQETLAAGDSYELCLTDESKLLGPEALDPWKLYKKLRHRNAAPFGAYLELGGATVVGSSPEQFLKWDRQGRLEFRPIKGTVKKGPDVTWESAAAILNSSKERAENLMIVDLIRHDLSGVVGAANCKVSQLMVIEEYETVYQLVSAIEGQLPEGKCGMDVLRVSLPPGP
ncbi:unnamed protein product [Parascedosporium putredinis]|uniref:aminodeoxychorismate synthase n=1 Tax=Parascedosporium putredinis TaxID=1442378 RepID=A0A9P1M925_9PEZI|nr:unnamed protein product [Parascedosporium putredinis]CAI7993878.1 unnamed protein product [Parascedosporium putredinis]